MSGVNACQNAASMTLDMRQMCNKLTILDKTHINKRNHEDVVLTLTAIFKETPFSERKVSTVF